MSAPPPVLDPRDRAALLAALGAGALGFVPELDLAGDATARALAAIVARDQEIVAASLNGLPARSRLAFADLCANALLPASAARVPLVFTLLDQAPCDVVLPARSRVAARLPPPAPSLASGGAPAAAATEAVFATEETVTLSRGRIGACYSIDPDSDTYTDHSAAIATGTPTQLFADAVPAPHELYLGHDEDLRLSGIAEISVAIDLRQDETPPERRPILLDWTYLSTEGWMPLAVASDTTARLTQDGLVVLRKECGPDAKQDAIAGRKSYWIRARVSDRLPLGRITAVTGATLTVETAVDFLPGDEVTIGGDAFARIAQTGTGRIELAAALPGARPGDRLRLADELPPLRPEGSDTAGGLPQLDVIRISVGFEKSGIAPDAAALDTAALEVNQRFQPFGARPQTNATFFLACKEAFQRKGASVRLRAHLLQPGVPDASKPFDVAVQYFNGTRWTEFPVFLGLSGTKALFTATSPALPPELRLTCPDDWAECEVNGVKGHWLKLRLAQGDFGTQRFTVAHPTTDTAEVQEVPNALVPPIVDRIEIAYVVATRPVPPGHCVALNDFVFADHTEDAMWSRRPFAPFLPVGDRAPAVHLGFTQPFQPGLISLLVAGLEDEPADDQRVPYVFEYRSARGWTELPVRDATEGFGRLGLIQFIGPPDAVAVDGVGGPLYRLRARLKPRLRTRAVRLAGMWLNGVWASHASTSTATTIGTGDGSPDLTLAVRPQALPVLAGETLEVREWQGRGEDWQGVVEGVPEASLRFERDPVDRVTPTALWVRWQAQPHLAASRPGDRHYVMDRADGLVRFGDGVHGRIPPAGAAILLTHDYGGGPVGNVAAGMANESRSTAAYLKSVTNPVAASGGAPVEPVAVLRDRAAQRLRHRDRAVAPADYAWLAREASPEVARAAPLPVTGPDGAVQPGWVGLVLVPKSEAPRPMPSQELRRRVLDHLRARAPLGIAGRIRLVDPEYAPISITAEIALRDPGQATAVEAGLRARLDHFLHALNGGADGMGWSFGATLYLSDIARALSGMPGVLALTRLGWLRDTALGEEALTLPPHVLPAPGDHQIKLLIATAGSAG
jgi:hypothetical protein